MDTAVRKRLIQVYKPGKFGFADFIRAIPVSASLAERKGFSFSVAFNHPLAAYFVCDASLYETDYKIRNQEDVKELENAMDSLDSIVIESNSSEFVGKPVPKGFYKKYIVPSVAFSEAVFNKMSELKIRHGQYTVFHIRCGDEDFTGKMEPSAYEKLRKRIAQRIGIIKRAYSLPILMISSSSVILTSFKAFPGLVFTNYETCHTCKAGSSADALQNTLIEFFVMKYAKKVFGISGSSFGTGVSGFSYWAAKMFEVPYIHFE